MDADGALVGRRLGTGGRYHVVAPLARGGMGVVYRARDSVLGREVAVKVLDPALTAQPAFLERFRREGQAVARLEHGHILPIYDFGIEGGLCYLVMQLVGGGTLKDRLAAGGGRPMAVAQAVHLAAQLLPALDHAHGRRIIHRDVKPANILLEGDWAYLADFGIAKLVRAEGDAGDYAGPTLTALGAAIGTPAYMAPEQAGGGPVDGRADLYAFGVVLYEALCGRVPYRGATPLEVAFHHLQAPLPPPRQYNPALPEAVSTVLTRALAKQPDARYPSGAGFAGALAIAASAAAAPRPQVARPEVTVIAQRSSEVRPNPAVALPAHTPARRSPGPAQPAVRPDQLGHVAPAPIPVGATRHAAEPAPVRPPALRPTAQNVEGSRLSGFPFRTRRSLLVACAVAGIAAATAAYLAANPLPWGSPAAPEEPSEDSSDEPASD